MLIGVRKRTVFLAYILVSLSLLIFIPLTPAMNSAVHENSKSGPFVSRILWSRSSFEDNTYQEKDILDLLNNEIDLFENQLEFDYIQELEAAEGIQVIHTPFNGFTHLSINCAKYPLNISAFRRAIAFSLDKERIADEIWGGQARVHDSVVPPVSHWSVEEQLNPHYYNGASDIGNSLLAEAGFYDIDADGYREAPDGSDFDVWLVFPPADVSQEANQCGWLVVQALEDLGIDVDPDDENYWLAMQRCRFHFDYDIILFGYGFTAIQPSYLKPMYHSDYYMVDDYNIVNWRNSSFDFWADQFSNALSLDEAKEAAEQMQLILHEECPRIVCYVTNMNFAYRTDRLESFQPSNTFGIGHLWTALKTRLTPSAGGPFGGDLRWRSDAYFDINPLIVCSCYPSRIQDVPWNSLMKYGPNGELVGWLAESYRILTHSEDPDILSGWMRIVFNLVQNASWSDGVRVTAFDVEYTLLRKLGFDLNYPEGVNGITSIFSPGMYELGVDFNTCNYWNIHKVALEEVFPKHIFLDVDEWMNWFPNPPEDEVIVAGPFAFAEHAGYSPEFAILEANPNFFHYPRTITTSPTTTTTTATTTTTTTTSTTTTSDGGSLSALSLGFVSGVAIVVSTAVIIKTVQRISVSGTHES